MSITKLFCTPAKPTGALRSIITKTNEIIEQVNVAKTTIPTIRDMSSNLLENRSGWEPGHYVAYNAGTILPLEGYTATDFIPVESANMVEVGDGVGMMAFYDKKKEFIFPGVGIMSPEHSDPHFYYIPENACYVRFSILDICMERAYAYLIKDDTGPVFYVAKNNNTVFIEGQQQNFTTVTAAVLEAVKYRNSTVYIDDGFYDILEELGAEYLSQRFHDNLRGIELYNNIKIVGTPQVYLSAQYNGNNATVNEYFSIFNISGSATMEGLSFIGKNIRYCVHDETGGKDIPHCTTRYSKCYFNLDNTQNAYCHAMCGIGCGLGYHNTLTIEDCYFDSPVTGDGWPDIFIHNHSQSGSRSYVVIRGNYCRNSTIRITWYGASTEISTAIVSNNSTARAIEWTAETPDSTKVNVNCVMWNNATH